MRSSGRLLSSADAPERGERFLALVAMDGVRVEQILSARADEPARYVQLHDEWVVVLEGGATLELDGHRIELGPGDWALLPRGVPHTVVRTDAGTSWLAVHAPPPPVRH